MLGISKISSACGLLLCCVAFTLNANAETPNAGAPAAGTSSGITPVQKVSAATSPKKTKRPANPALVLQAKVAGVQKQFEHESFNLHSVVKASVFAFKPGDDEHKVGYERFWFHDGKAVGVEKRRGLDVGPGSAIAIQVLQSPSPTNQETKASANVVMRLVLDTLLHKNEVTGVTVPAISFSAISQELQFRKGHLLPEGQEPPADAHVIFELNAGASNMKQTLYWI